MIDYRTLRVVFMGTPEFAVASLDALLKSGVQVVAVVTAPDKAAGRGLQRAQSAVKSYALANDLPLLQPTKLRDETFLNSLKALNADVQVVVAFRMLPEVVWNMPPMGTINLHGSLLPQYRGAAPINWAVINGDKETGVTTFKLKHEIDTGDILLQEKFAIADGDTAGTVHDTMKAIGAQLLVTTLQRLCDGSLKEIAQKEASSAPLKKAPKIFTHTCEIDYTKSVAEVYNLIRGLSPFPTAFTYLQEKVLKVVAGEKEYLEHQLMPGACITDGKSYLKYACRDGFISFTEIQLAGKKRMQVADFLRGHRLS